MERSPYTMDKQALDRLKSQWAQKYKEYLSNSRPHVLPETYATEIEVMAAVRAYFSVSTKVSPILSLLLV